MSRFFEYRGDCGKKSLLKTRLLRNAENGASASEKKKKKSARRNQGSKAPVPAHLCCRAKFSITRLDIFQEVNEIMRRLPPPKPLVERKPFHC